MKKIGIFITAIILSSLGWMGFIREPLPPIPTITTEISEEVDFDFSINSIDYSGLELSLNDKVEGKGMYVEFKMNNAWETGRPGLVINGIKAESSFDKGMSPKKYLENKNRPKKGNKDFGDFMEDSKGKSVSTYKFKQTLVEDENGKTFMRMSYDGSEMEMIQTLEIPRPITLPAHISRKFSPNGIIQFQRGVVTFDNKIKGFYIPVLIR
ncbi:hypothetical protein ACPUEN_10640 [Algoriphagus yeomjeoni]|uniref:hypothetical protein n=1 Tax=Algoriphagus yeomjeoni TaxID=291403 RepID=UPI003CE51F39